MDPRQQGTKKKESKEKKWRTDRQKEKAQAGEIQKDSGKVKEKNKQKYRKMKRRQRNGARDGEKQMESYMEVRRQLGERKREETGK